MRTFSCTLSPVINEDGCASAALALENGNLEIWNVDPQQHCTRQRIEPNTHGDEEALRTAWNSDGTSIASGGSDGVLCIWDNELNKKQSINLIVKEPEDQAVYACWFRNGDAEVCVAYDDMVCGYDVEKATRVWCHQFEPSVENVTFRNPKGKRLVFDATEHDGLGLVAAALSDGTLGVFDVKSDKTITSVEAHAKATTSCRFSQSTGASIVTGSIDGLACVWDTRTWWRRFATVNHQSAVYGAQFLENEQDRILTWAKQSLIAWGTTNKEKHATPLDFPVICADERHGLTLACGEMEPSVEDHCCSHDHSHHGSERQESNYDSCAHSHHTHDDHEAKKRSKSSVSGIFAIKTSDLLASH